MRPWLGVMFGVAACGFPQPADVGGDGGSTQKDASVDAKPDAMPDADVDAPPSGPCDPLAQTGCAASEKCTWLVDATMPQYVGHIGCAPNGTAAAGAACTYGQPGMTGYDDCAKGSICSTFHNPGQAGVCKDICDAQGGTPMCDASHVCVTYAELLKTDESSPPAGGVCDPQCNPLTDNDFDGSGADTKTTNVCGSAANVGCYGAPRDTPPKTSFMCAGDINAGVAQPTGLRHRVQCTDANMCSNGGTVFINSCNQGYLPLLYESTNVTTVICTAMCKPANCSVGACGSSGLNRQGVAGDACRNPDRLGTFTATKPGTSSNAAVPAFETGGEHCRYLWSFELDDNGNLLRSPWSDTLGFCFDHSKYQYDSNGDDTPDTDFPTCAQLASGSGMGADATKPYEFWGAAALGCEDTTKAGLATGKKLPAMLLEKMRRADLPRPLYRPLMR